MAVIRVTRGGNGMARLHFLGCAEGCPEEKGVWFSGLGRGCGWSPRREERTLESMTEKLTSRDSDVSTSSASVSSPGPPSAARAA